MVSNPKNVVLNDPDFIAAENALQKDDAAGALKILNGIAPKYSENEAFLFKLGAVYERLNLLDDAVQAYQHALKLEPTSGIGWTSLGGTLAKLKHFADAEEAAKQAVKQSPDFGPAWALLKVPGKVSGTTEPAPQLDRHCVAGSRAGQTLPSAKHPGSSG